MKKLRFLSLILSMVLCVAVCDFAKARSNEPPREIICVDGKYYLEFPDELEKSIGCGMQKYIYYPSMDEFYSTVSGLDFSNDEIAVMRSSFIQDDNGILVCNMNDLYQAVLPDGAVVESIAWFGYGYTTKWNNSAVANGHLQVLEDEEHFNTLMNNMYPVDFFDREHVEVLDYVEDKKEEYIAKKWIYTTTTEYGKSKFRDESYEITDTNGSYVIRLTYDLESTVNYFSEKRFSDTIPAKVTIFGNSGEQYWYCDFLNIECALDIDWLMSFGIVPYIPE